jgi:(E)-4-hydroxy-3-methylbut-2-enyl-diphosphate synthase
MVQRHETVAVRVGKVTVGGGAPVVVQSMTSTDTADVAATTKQCLELAQAGSELVRVTVNLPEAAAAVPEIRKRLDDAGCEVPLIGDFHYNGHTLLTSYPEMAKALEKYRINPGNVGTGRRRDEQFATICAVARENGKAVRIGVNGGSLNQELVLAKMQENTDHELGRSSEEILNECMVLSALQSTELALECGLRREQIVISCKVSRPRELISLYRDLAGKTVQPLHLGLTEAGMGTKGLVWSSAAMESETRSASPSPRAPAATGERRSTRRASSSSRSESGPSPRASPPAPAAAGRPRRRSRSWPSGSRVTCARRCLSGRPSARESRR